MQIKRLNAKIIKDTRGENTICVYLKTRFGRFYASAPNGKSCGKFEAKPWKKNILSDIRFVNKFNLCNIKISCFDELQNVEDIFRKNIGANTMIAIEYAFLKSLAKEKNKEVWQVINPRASKLPLLAGNAIGGGKHSYGKKPDFQEFLFIPETNVGQAVMLNKIARKKCHKMLSELEGHSIKTNDENAWQTSLSNDDVKNVILDTKDEIKKELRINCEVGIDAASSTFFRDGKYFCKNPKKIFGRDEQIKLMKKIMNEVYYIEDPLQEQDFLGFAKLKRNSKLLVGDDLTATNFWRIKKAWKSKSINGVIIKPNQCGSLIEVKKIADFCKKKKIKMIFSHRSGETHEDILADLAFGFQAEFIKAGIAGSGREEKLRRLINIEKSV